MLDERVFAELETNIGAFVGRVIDISEAPAKFIGQQKTVCGTVANANYDAKSKCTLLNLDKPSPNHVFTAYIGASDRDKFEKPPETLYSGKEICVTGMIQSYQGRPEIIVKEPSQIKVK
jgi:micrococcal nuclease